MDYNIINSNLQELLREISVKSDKAAETNKVLAKYYYDKNDIKNANRVKNCCQYIELIQGENYSKINKMNMCMNRLCPTCAAARARERFYNLYPVIQNILNENNFAAHVVFTIPNQQESEIGNTISQLNKSIYRFYKNLNVKNYTRNLEITYNNNEKTYHIHAHSIAIVEKENMLSKFIYKMSKEEFNNIMTELRSKWTKICIKQNIKNINTICRLYIKALDNPKYIIEATKYNAKDWDIPKHVIYILAEHIQNKRLFEVYGAEMKKEYKKQKEINKTLHKAEKYEKFINLPEKFIKAVFVKDTKTQNYTLFDISLQKKVNTF